MFVGLLKWPKNNLESEQHPGQGTLESLSFGITGPAHFRVRANLAGLVAGLGW